MWRPAACRDFVGRFANKPLFSVARQRLKSGNRPKANGFDSVVLISVSSNVLADGLHRLLPAQTDRMAFVGADGFGRSTTSGLNDIE